MALVHPAYFAPISQYVAIAKSATIEFEIEDNFQKQTYRNRCYINTSNGKLLLNVPIKHHKGVKQKTKDVRIDYTENWQLNHLKALKSAYSSSPFFEFYIDDLQPIFKSNHRFLIDLNLRCHDFIMDTLQLQLSTSFSTEYLKESDNDFRKLINAKVKTAFQFNRYIQVFEQENGFIANLSMLDLIFMEGPNALNYLEQQNLPSF
jgi:hypothetical protein